VAPLLEPCCNIKRKKMNVNRNVTERIVRRNERYCVAVLLNVKKNEKRVLKKMSGFRHAPTEPAPTPNT
jgi:hypothetical protein